MTDREIIKESNGFAVNKGNYKAIAEIINGCFSNRGKMKSIALRGRISSIEEFSCDQMLNSILNIYRNFFYCPFQFLI